MLSFQPKSVTKDLLASLPERSRKVLTDRFGLSAKGESRTLDAIGRVAGERCILDWKSGEKIYPDALIQVAAYQALWNENYPDSKLGPGVHIVRIGPIHPARKILS